MAPAESLVVGVPSQTLTEVRDDGWLGSSCIREPEEVRRLDVPGVEVKDETRVGLGREGLVGVRHQIDRLVAQDEGGMAVSRTYLRAFSELGMIDRVAVGLVYLVGLASALSGIVFAVMGYWLSGVMLLCISMIMIVGSAMHRMR